MIVVSDSTPLITLMKAEKLYILQRLFGEVLIPETVFFLNLLPMKVIQMKLNL